MSPTEYTTRNKVVVNTAIVCRGRELPPVHFQIDLAETDNVREKRYVFITRDADLYEDALAAEGTGERIDATWVIGQKWNGQPAQVLTALTRAVRRTRSSAA